MDTASYDRFVSIGVHEHVGRDCNEQGIASIATHWDRIRAIEPVLFSEKFRRTLLFYLGGAAETFEAAREIINCYHITFVKGHFTESASA